MILSLILAICALSILALIAGILLGLASTRFQVNDDPVIDIIDRALPQSQCGQCGWPGCRPYAQAVCQQGEKINKCAPGGEQVMLKLAEILGVSPQPLDESDIVTHSTPMVAFIDESQCIGCIKCIQACPVDAIIGTTRALHTVISDYCTGCGLCLAPCPMDCISLLPVAGDNKRGAKAYANTIPVQFIETKTHV